MSVIQDDYVKQAEVIRSLTKKKKCFRRTKTQLRVLPPP
ncbi:type III-A CRISPR-associated protein Csm2, partial [Mycobacterium tuberculosis]